MTAAVGSRHPADREAKAGTRMSTTTTVTAQHRVAATALLVLGGLNLLVAVLLLTAGARGRPVAVTAFVAGLLLVGLGVAVRRGSRAALIAASAVLGVVVVMQVLTLATAPDVIGLVRLLITAWVLWLVMRPLRSR
jgi:hypothetical protein